MEGAGCTAALFAGLSSLPELDDRVDNGNDCGDDGGGGVGGTEHCELRAASRVDEGFSGADPGRICVCARSDRGRAGD